MGAQGQRRRIIIGGALVGIGAATAYWYAATDRRRAMARAAQYVLPGERWGTVHLGRFLAALPDEAMQDLLRAQRLGEGSPARVQDVEKVRDHLLWLSTNVLEYPIRDSSKQDYHDVVVWASSRTTSAGMASPTLSGDLPTFALERELLKRMFANVWDKLNPAQRQELLDRIDPNHEIKDRAAILAMSGAAVLGSISMAAAFAGFALYTTMSVAIATAAGAVGVTLPFAVYTGASSVIALLSGPVGWAILAIAGVSGIALAGRANVFKTAQLIAQIHTLKAEALMAAGLDSEASYGSTPR
jgi:uncharacterized protein YaaW (UPF0174 family)